MPPILKEVKEEFRNNIRIIKVNVDRNPYIASRYHVQRVPTIMIFKKGLLKWKTEGLCSAIEIKHVVQKHIPD